MWCFHLLHIVLPIKLELETISTYIVSRFASRICFLKRQFSGGGFLKYMKCVIMRHYSMNMNKVILCDNTLFCDEEQTEILRFSPNFDGNVEID